MKLQWRRKQPNRRRVSGEIRKYIRRVGDFSGGRKLCVSGFVRTPTTRDSNESLAATPSSLDTEPHSAQLSLLRLYTKFPQVYVLVILETVIYRRAPLCMYVYSFRHGPRATCHVVQSSRRKTTNQALQFKRANHWDLFTKLRNVCGSWTVTSTSFTSTTAAKLIRLCHD